MKQVAVVVTALALLGADARAASAAATWTLDVFPSHPRAGDHVTVQLRPYWSLPRNPPALFPKRYPWALVAISPQHRSIAVHLRRSPANPYVWTGAIHFPSRGAWVLCVLNASALGRCIPHSTGWHRLHVRPRRAPAGVWQRLERPFHVPTVPAGTACPTTGRDPKGDLSRFRGFAGTAWGEGPAYPGGLDTGAGAPVLHYADPIPPDSAFFGSAWSGNKVLWIVDPSYAGPLLIRGRQLDGPNALRFDDGRLPPREIRIRASEPLRARPSYTRVRGPGCYAYQVDGLGFSKVIVFKAQPVHPASPPGSAAIRRPLHLPRLRPGQRCPVSASRPAPWTSKPRQTLNGRGPVFLIGVGGARGGTIEMGFGFPDNLGWYGQKTPWAVSRTYDGPLLVRGARIGKRGAISFARTDGEHLSELFWDAGVDQGAPPIPAYRFLASETLVRAPGCYAYQLDGTSFSEIIVVRVRG